MLVKIIRVVFVFSCILMGFIWSKFVLENMVEAGHLIENQQLGIACEGLLDAIVATLELLGPYFITQELYERFAPAIVAIVLALLAGYSISRYLLFWFPSIDITSQVLISVSVVLLFGYAGIHLGLTRASNWESLMTAVKHRQLHNANPVSLKIVDTSVLIDGRIADISESGFLEGTLLIPRFVLKELQNIADSADVVRRAKGRRGLDILKNLQESTAPLGVSIIEDNPHASKEVDGKLVVLAKQYGAKILTTDFNLNKVAQIDGVVVLNINDLANALKPAVLPDELMEVKLMKEGKEPTQAVGYLDDGTMVVVDGGRNYLGKNVQVLVTSILQTSAGRMIFTRFHNLT